MSTEDRYPAYRAPQQDGAVLCVPAWPTIKKQLTSDRRADDSHDVKIGEVALGELSREARQALLADAYHFTSSYCDIDSPGKSDAPIVLTGHQPEFVHPGVWLKNFAAARLAQQVEGTAINLVIDSDLCRSPSIRVPTGTVDEPRAVDMPLDQSTLEMPYEERKILDRHLWDSLGERVTQAVRGLVDDPLIAQWWDEVRESPSHTRLLGNSIAEARHRLEHRWGSVSLQLPQSQVCQTAAFRRFAVHLLSDAKRLQRDYNGALADYRQAHRLRSPAQPLPDLAIVDEDWLETPFWVWSQDDPVRRALFIRTSSNGLQLSDRQQWQGELPAEIDDQIERLDQWERQGIKLRTRALITTLYARLLLADTFIHGIGGAKYDQVTDELCRRFFGIELSPLVVLSGTLRLPIEHARVSAERINEIRQSLRQLRFHPESQLDTSTLDSGAADLVAQKQHWVKTRKTAANAAERHAQIVAANEGLQPWLEKHRFRLEGELSACLTQTRKNRVLETREYPFCVFPVDLIRRFLLDFSLPML